MANRPSLLDLRSNSNQSANSTSSRPLRSPRMHIAGEVPPELSPLDAFALQSRLLARQLQESNKEGNRVSRLPPLTMESPLIQQGRSDYFRSMSHDSASELGDSPDRESSGLGLKTEVEEAFTPEERPRSMHPRMSQIPPTLDDAVPVPAIPSRHARDLSRGRQLNPDEQQRDLFGARQARSPSPMHSDTHSQPDKLPERSPARKDTPLPLPSSQHSVSATSSPEKSKQESFDELGLAPPRALFPRRSSSIISSPTPGDEETASSMGGSFHSLPMRKLSSGSAAFANAMPSPAIGSFQRSPSVASDSSALPRPSFNFSRPLSRAGTPGLEMPTRQASSDSQPSFILADESAHTPVSMHSEAFMDQQNDDGRSAAPSYIYSKFSLPRGKTIQRLEPSENQSQASFQGEQPMVPPSNVHRYPLGAPPSPPTRPSSSSARTVPDDAVSMMSSMPRPSMDTSKRSMENPRLGVMGHPSPNPSRPSIDTGRQSEDVPRGRTLTSPLHHTTARGRTPASVGTSDSASTIRQPPTSRSFAPSASEMSAEDHLAKGIECHENGSLNESTYHLRHAARQNHPTAMLLYALACRHGWGMRANQREGVEWLRKAAEYASIEIADDEDRAKEGKPANFLESKTRKAQFALSIYELGVSHMNGWGIEQDKSLALRCFEIAGTWGDVDALAEAGFCYAQGIGCKKDLKKSAKFYRMAEAKGMSMVGNSWIHKTKYNDDDNDKDKNKRKARSKSRTRAMFSRKAGS
ncbi:Protein DSF2 [Tolypocladium ophioglossoides CBS 100239]|uniref:Protein DSF2 n=1 Tax=Tolypocladium ophioglossoides (strain CBS 100239) TaxID=1163406 RepID=A0A0L0NKV5_TOLOC|nr:Protein DSF2 [Tolypocladium ophioglossoides CBS 100239]